MMTTKETTTMNRFAPIRALMFTDVYKLGHRNVADLAGKTEVVYSNWTNRGSRIDGIDHVVHFGLQAFLTKLTGWFDDFFAADEDEVCSLYEERLLQILGPNTIGSDHVRDLHRLGHLPLLFSAVPEGTPVPIRVPSFVIENTHSDFGWLTNYVETIISAEVWQASTSATIAHDFRKVLVEGCERTGGDPATLDWAGHDFSFRGMSSVETAAASSAGHLLSFYGTDSLPSLEWIEDFYGGEYIAGSVPATEHSVMCVLSETVGEYEAFSRILDLYPSGITSVVSDTFNLWTVLTDFLPRLHDRIMARDGKLVIRPDSGDPVDILTGTVRGYGGGESPEQKGVIELLWDEFGGTVNDAGFKVLDSHVGAIYGDSITRDRAQQIIDRLASKGFASTNVVFGIGSYTYQYQTRDTFMSAIKATWAQVDGVGYDLRKDPITDNGTKKSAKGRLAVFTDEETGDLYLVEGATPDEEEVSELQPVWFDGEFLIRQTFAEVRQVLAESKY